MAVPGPIWFTDSYGDVMRHVVTYTTFDSTSTDVLGLDFTRRLKQRSFVGCSPQTRKLGKLGWWRRAG